MGGAAVIGVSILRVLLLAGYILLEHKTTGLLAGFSAPIAVYWGIVFFTVFTYFRASYLDPGAVETCPSRLLSELEVAGVVHFIDEHELRGSEETTAPGETEKRSRKKISGRSLKDVAQQSRRKKNSVTYKRVASNESVKSAIADGAALDQRSWRELLSSKEGSGDEPVRLDTSSSDWSNCDTDKGNDHVVVDFAATSDSASRVSNDNLLESFEDGAQKTTSKSAIAPEKLSQLHTRASTQLCPADDKFQHQSVTNKGAITVASLEADERRPSQNVRSRNVPETKNLVKRRKRPKHYILELNESDGGAEASSEDSDYRDYSEKTLALVRKKLSLPTPINKRKQKDQGGFSPRHSTFSMLKHSLSQAGLTYGSKTSPSATIGNTLVVVASATAAAPSFLVEQGARFAERRLRNPFRKKKEGSRERLHDQELDQENESHVLSEGTVATLNRRHCESEPDLKMGSVPAREPFVIELAASPEVAPRSAEVNWSNYADVPVNNARETKYDAQISLSKTNASAMETASTHCTNEMESKGLPVGSESSACQPTPSNEQIDLEAQGVDRSTESEIPLHISYTKATKEREEKHGGALIHYAGILGRRRLDGAPCQSRIELRFCDRCYIYQPLRTKHCYDCRRCVRTLDHHCPWLGTCVGERNRLWFFWYLVLQSVELVWTTVKYAENFVKLKDIIETGARTLESSVLQLIALHIIVVVGFVLMLFFSIMVLSLLCYHTFLACSNVTTWEAISWKQITYLKYLKERHGSPFSKGCLANLAIYCCVPGVRRIFRYKKYSNDYKYGPDGEIIWDHGPQRSIGCADSYCCFCCDCGDDD